MARQQEAMARRSPYTEFIWARRDIVSCASVTPPGAARHFVRASKASSAAADLPTLLGMRAVVGIIIVIGAAAVFLGAGGPELKGHLGLLAAALGGAAIAW